MFGLLLAACTSAPGTPPAPTPPPTWGVPISGGNLLITRDGTHAVIADPDRDRLMTVDLGDTAVVVETTLAPGSEPGRLVEDASGRVHVALRGSGELLTLTPVGEQPVGEPRRRVCGEPRGLAYDAATDLVHVACATGELVSLPAAGGDPIRTLHLERDLRDVIVGAGSQLSVTRFRTAEVLTIDATGAVSTRIKPPVVQRFATVGGELSSTPPEMVDAIPEVAWRTIALPDGSLLMSHQRKHGSKLEVFSGGYSTQCGDGNVESALTRIAPDGSFSAIAPMVHGALPVDIAAKADGSEIAIVAAGAQIVAVVSADKLGRHDDDHCGDPPDGFVASVINDQLGAPTSVAYRASGELVIYYPELPALVIHNGTDPSAARTIRLPGPFGYDSGRALFHRQTAAGLACASCHPEGRDDGQVWDFETGPRRTQNLAGGVLHRTPFHWNGDIADLDLLMTAVFEERMAGFSTTHSEHASLGPWLDRIPAPRGVIVDPAAIARGEALFVAPEQGCATCHLGESYTTNALVDVGTGGVFKVPSLVGVASRAPYMHTGCAATLRDRFGACGGGETHGHTAQLTESQLADLIAYLESL